jgi:hypothetical protein
MDKKYILLIILILVLIYLYYRIIIKKYDEKFNNIKYHKLIRSEHFSNKPTLKLKFGTKFYIGDSSIKERHHFQSEKQFINYFLPDKYDYIIVNLDEKSDITIWDIYFDDNSRLRDDEINILICVENVPHWNMYKHYSKYGEYNDNKIKIYMYNHINKLVKTETYLSQPLIHSYINYYNNTELEPSEYTKFNNKKFCLMINKSKLNPQINETITELEKLGEIDSLSMYPELLDKSCYHSIELLNIFNKYKFVICFENSYADGYITEKIFNCFFAKTIPIYKGSEKINDYINKSTYIDARDTNYINEIIKIKDDENLYNTYINSLKISDMYNDENYNQELISIIDTKLKTENYGTYINNSSQIYIVYFIYINPDRNWKLILENQMKDLKEVNILEDNKLFVVISSSDDNNTFEAINIINTIFLGYNHNIEFTFEKNNLFEYSGIKKVYELALINPNKILIYFHSKGMVFHENKGRNKQENILTKTLFNSWNKTLSIFNKNNNINKIGLLPSDFNGVWFNFWWASSNYINKLEEPIITENRYYYELWLSKIKDTSNYDNNDSYSLYSNQSEKYSQIRALEIIENMEKTF